MKYEIEQQLRRHAMEHIKPNFAELGRIYNVDPRTMKRAYERMQEDLSLSGATTERPVNTRPSILDPFKSIVEDKMEQGIGARAIYFYLKERKGYQGGYNTVKRYAKRFKELQVRKATIRVETSPGMSAQVDWKEDITLHTTDGVAHTFSVFVLKLGYSRFTYYELVEDRKQKTLFYALGEAFQEIGGVPQEIWFDNMAQVVNRKDSTMGNKVLNSTFMEFSKDIGFKTITHRIWRPQTKGKVENVVGVIKRRLAAYDYELSDYHEFHSVVLNIMEQVNNEVSQAINVEPRLLLADEKKYLLPFNRDVLEAYTDNRHYRKVSKEAMINYQGNKYSVDPTYIGHKLEVRPIENELRLYYNAELIKIHQISNKPFNYHESDARKILASDLLANADENVIEQYITDHLSDYDDFIKLYDEGDGWRTDD